MTHAGDPVQKTADVGSRTSLSDFEENSMQTNSDVDNGSDSDSSCDSELVNTKLVTLLLY